MLSWYSATAEGQPREGGSSGDLRTLHDLAVNATVVVEGAAGFGTGWLLAQNGPIPLVVTARHVVEPARRTYRIRYYAGSSASPVVGTARLSFVSPRIDLAFLIPEAPPPETARALRLEDGDIVRGERVILAGHPFGVLFQTTEGVVTRASPDIQMPAYTCGYERNCVVVDAPSFHGSSGGSALNARGRVVGMLWGGPPARVRFGNGIQVPAWVTDSSFAFLIHVRVIEEELRQEGERRRRGREGAAP